MYGLVLEGGGAKGAYHAGALKAIKELKLDVSGVAGTSIGALNGAMFVQNKIEEIYEYWYNISPAQVFDVEEKYVAELMNFSLNQKNLLYLINKAKEVFQNRGLDTSIMKKTLSENIDEDLIRSSDIDFAIITVSLSDFKPLELFVEDIPEGKIADYILASSYLPAFKMQRIDGKILIDGGFYDNLPINTLIKKGYKKIIAVRTYGMGDNNYENNNSDIIYINPSENLGRMLNFDQKNARRNIKMGYYDTMKYFKNLKGNKYYIYPPEDSKYFIEFILNLPENTIKSLSEQFKIVEQPKGRLLFEALIPRIINFLELDYQADYGDMLISLLENIAVKAGIERFEFYSFQNLLKQVRGKYNKSEKTISKRLPQFIKSSNLLPQKVKEEIITGIAEKIFLKDREVK